MLIFFAKTSVSNVQQSVFARKQNHVLTWTTAH